MNPAERAAWLMRKWELGRDELDVAARMLEVAPLSDAEWESIQL